jgi:hypothetical protein
MQDDQKDPKTMVLARLNLFKISFKGKCQKCLTHPGVKFFSWVQNEVAETNQHYLHTYTFTYICCVEKYKRMPNFRNSLCKESAISFLDYFVITRSYSANCIPFSRRHFVKLFGCKYLMYIKPFAAIRKQFRIRVVVNRRYQV